MQTRLLAAAVRLPRFALALDASRKWRLPPPSAVTRRSEAQLPKQRIFTAILMRSGYLKVLSQKGQGQETGH
jgi:hypothetical protein